MRAKRSCAEAHPDGYPTLFLQLRPEDMNRAVRSSPNVVRHQFRMQIVAKHDGMSNVCIGERLLHDDRPFCY